MHATLNCHYRLPPNTYGNRRLRLIQRALSTD